MMPAAKVRLPLRRVRSPQHHGGARPCLRPALVALITVPMLAYGTPADIVDLSIEELGNIRITSLSKRPERVRDAAASVFVISREDIHRAGITSIPEALRLAPGVEVGRTGVHSWTISIRGFNNDLSNKLLVLIDGRSVYSPLYSGVFWDVQDTLLSDLDRIEVISGPGGTMWGANAVNGVINIITRHAAETADSYAEIAGGKESSSVAALRHGRQVAPGTFARAYLKYLDQDHGTNAAGASTGDPWHIVRGGFRLDQDTDAYHFVLQGDIYKGQEPGNFRGLFTIGTLPGASVSGNSSLAGRNLLARWTRKQADGGGQQWQAYYDYTERNIPNTFSEARHTVDLDVQNHLLWGERHDIVMGAGYRHSSDTVAGSLFSTFTPARRGDQTYNIFIEDKIDLANKKLFLSLGTKVEHNDYTGYAVQPNMRLNWLATPHQNIWMSVSRALRIPSRIDTDVRVTTPIPVPSVPFPVYAQISGSSAVEAETLVAYEAGYRIQPHETLSFDFAMFSNHYDKLASTEPSLPVVNTKPPLPHIILPNTRANGVSGRSHGATMAVKWQPLPNWRMQMHYANVQLTLRTDPGSVEKNALRIAGNSPRHQLSLFSNLDLPRNISVFVGARYVSQLPNLKVPQYIAVDASLAWQPRSNIDLSLTVRNLNSPGHFEFNTVSRQARNVLVKGSWRF